MHNFLSPHFRCFVGAIHLDLASNVFKHNLPILKFKADVGCQCLFCSIHLFIRWRSLQHSDRLSNHHSRQFLCTLGSSTSVQCKDTRIIENRVRARNVVNPMECAQNIPIQSSVHSLSGSTRTEWASSSHNHIEDAECHQIGR